MANRWSRGYSKGYEDEEDVESKGYEDEEDVEFKGYEDEEDVESRICNEDFVSVLAFNKEFHTIVFRIIGRNDDIVCFDFEEKKVVSTYAVDDYMIFGSPNPYYLEHHPDVPPVKVDRMWIEKTRAPYREKHRWLFEQGFCDDPEFVSFERHPAVLKYKYGRLWIEKTRARCKAKNLELFKQGFIDDPGFAVNRG
ncbi:hypothetical protein H6P81_007981 [Aristolochia fimbriata]|uniref:Uncharacterized protein n=1 Tax=Aristolochia fimbriata TaxID=158543 RepID=A0AAV7F1W8_ARIFI|nr:hypothetical protein H6P81_007981 [Aristolochia fimbriata]